MLSMGWITQEFSRRRPPQAPQASDQDRQQAVANLWLELREGLQADINEYNRLGGAAIFDATGVEQVAVSDPATGLQVRIEAGIRDRHVRYNFDAVREEVPAPDGGFFSIRPSPAGQAELFSADQALTLDEARRVLLQPVLFPTDTSTPLQQSA